MQLENCITKGYDYVIVQSNNNAAQAPYVMAIAEAGIPVVTTNPTTHQSDLDGETGDPEVDNAVMAGTGTVDADPVEQAAVGARRAVEEVPENANVVVFRGPSGNYHAEKRREAWDTYFFDVRDDVNILYEDYANWNNDEAMALMETWVQGGTHIDAIISMNDNMAAGAIEAVRNNTDYIEDGVPNFLAYGVDGTAQGCLLIKEGLLTATALQDAGSNRRKKYGKIKERKRMIMEGKMKAAVMTKLKYCEIQEVPIPQPKDDEVLVKVENVGVCGSDLHYYEQGRISDFIVEFPYVLGHEAGGTVVEVGKNVKKIKVGDRVAMEPGKTCGKCEFCKTGRYNLCPDVIFFATPPVGGVFQEYVAHEEGLCFKIPDNMDTEEAALIEPLAVGMHAANQADAHIGQTVVVTGSGCIGLMSLLSVKARGVSKVIVVDVIEKRLEQAKKLGADFVINGKTEDTIARIMELTDGNGFDVGIETSGSQICASQLMRAAKKGATIVFVGYSASGEMTLPMGVALDKELNMKTVFRYRNIYPMAIDAVASGKINVKGVVTDRFELDDIQNALTACVEDKANIVKGVIHVAG